VQQTIQKINSLSISEDADEVKVESNIASLILMGDNVVTIIVS